MAKQNRVHIPDITLDNWYGYWTICPYKTDQKDPEFKWGIADYIRNNTSTYEVIRSRNKWLDNKIEIYEPQSVIIPEEFQPDCKKYDIKMLFVVPLPDDKTFKAYCAKHLSVGNFFGLKHEGLEETHPQTAEWILEWGKAIMKAIQSRQ